MFDLSKNPSKGRRPHLKACSLSPKRNDPTWAVSPPLVKNIVSSCSVQLHWSKVGEESRFAKTTRAAGRRKKD